jgi:hypothetical protein
MSKKDDEAQDAPKHETHRRRSHGGLETRDEDGRTIYSSGGQDILSHKKGDAHYLALLDSPEHQLKAGRSYNTDEADPEAAVKNAAEQVAAALPKQEGVSER